MCRAEEVFSCVFFQHQQDVIGEILMHHIFYVHSHFLQCVARVASKPLDLPTCHCCIVLGFKKQKYDSVSHTDLIFICSTGSDALANPALLYLYFLSPLQQHTRQTQLMDLSSTESKVSMPMQVVLCIYMFMLYIYMSNQVTSRWRNLLRSHWFSCFYNC